MRFSPGVLTRTHYSLTWGRRMPREWPDLSELEGVVSSKVLDAMRVAHDELTKIGVPHLLVGGLAVGAYGYPRATKDVDFLVGDEAFELHGAGVVTLKPGVPIQVAGVLVDHVSAQANEEHLRSLLRQPHTGEPPVAPIEALVYLKLKSPRAKDRADVIELIKGGIDLERCRGYLGRHAAHLLLNFDSAIQAAAREEDAQ